ncbi:MAG TPA: HU family DNA-binding protein [Acidobacteriota bacterium]|nr:HU family DNA-binding protein [Acidobacteriota bacterium]
MNRTQLVDAIAKQAKLSKKQANSALQATLDSISDAMKKGQRVALVGFGTFGAVMRKARKGINPKTRQVIKIAAKRVPKFKAGKQLSKIVAKIK